MPVDTGAQPGKRLRVNLTHPIAATRPDESAFAQPSNAHLHAVRIRTEHVDARAAAITEHVCATSQSVVTELHRYRRQQFVHATTQVDRFGRNPRRPRTQHAASSRSSAANQCGSVPTGTKTRSAPRRTWIADAGTCSPTTRTGTSACPGFVRKRRCSTLLRFGSVIALSPCRLPYRLCVSPLARHASTCCCQNRAGFKIAMLVVSADGEASIGILL